MNKLIKSVAIFLLCTCSLLSKEVIKDLGPYKLSYTVTDDSLISSVTVIRDKVVMFSYEGEIAGKRTMKIFMNPEFGFPASVNFLENNEFLAFSYIKEKSTERIIWNKNEQKFDLEINAVAKDPFAPDEADL